MELKNGEDDQYFSIKPFTIFGHSNSSDDKIFINSQIQWPTVPPEDDSLPGWVIAVIIVSSILLLAVAGFLFWRHKVKKRQLEEQRSSEYKDAIKTETPYSVMSNE